METPPKPSLLVVEDEPLLRQTFSRLLGKKYEVRIAENAEEALNMYQPSDAVLSDINLGGGITGLELAEQLSTRNNNARITIMSGGLFGDQEATLLNLLKKGIVHSYVPKFEIMKIVDCIEGRLTYLPRALQ